MMDREYDEFLERLSQCLLDADLELWHRTVRTPLVLITDKGTLTLKDDVSVANAFWQYRMLFNVKNINWIVRQGQSLEECDDGSYLGTFETHLFCGEYRIIKPYISTALLRKEPCGLLKAGSIFNALAPCSISKAKITNPDRALQKTRVSRHVSARVFH